MNLTNLSYLITFIVVVLLGIALLLSYSLREKGSGGKLFRSPFRSISRNMKYRKSRKEWEKLAKEKKRRRK